MMRPERETGHIKREEDSGQPSEPPMTSLARLLATLDIKASHATLSYDGSQDDQLTSLMSNLALGPADSSDRIQACDELVKALWKRFQDKEDELALMACIEVENELLQMHPLGHPDRNSRCFALVLSLQKAFDRTGDLALLEEGVRIWREALAAEPPDSAERAQTCTNLATSLQAIFDQTKDSSFLDECIQFQREALALTPVGQPNRGIPCLGLALALNRDYKQSQVLGVLEEAIQLFREAEELLPAGHPYWFRVCNNLFEALLSCYERVGTSALLDEAISVSRKAVAICPKEHPRRAEFCGNLAVGLTTYFRRTNEVMLLDEAIQLQQEVLELEPSGHPSQAGAYTNLALSLKARFDHSGDHAVLQESVKIQRLAFALCPPGGSDRRILCRNLAMLLHHLFDQTANSELLNEVIRLQREVMSLCPPGHTMRGSSCASLAISLGARFKQTGDADLLHESIVLQREALALLPTGHTERAELCANLAMLLQTQFNHSKDLKLMNECIALQREAIRLWTSADQLHARENLAIFLATHFHHSGDRSLLDEATSLQFEILALKPADHPDRAPTCMNLAITLRSTSSSKDTTELVQTLSTLLEEALALYPSTHPSYWCCLKELAWVSLLKGDHDSALQYVKDALKSPTDNVADLISGVIPIMSQVGVNPAGMTYVQGAALLDAYTSILELVPLLTGLAYDRSAQLKRIAECSAIGPAAYSLASRLGKLTAGVELLERARGTIWSQSLYKRNPELKDVPIQLAERLREVLRCMNAPSAGAPTHHAATRLFLGEHDLVHEQNSHLQQVLREIRLLPGLSNFMRGLDRQTLVSAAALNPVVVLVAEKHQCHAVIIAAPDKPVANITFQGIGQSVLQELAFKKLTSQRRGLSTKPDDEDDRGLKISTLRKRGLSSPEILGVIWMGIVKPIISHLGFMKAEGQHRPRIHWCPTGAFTSVPLHAAGLYDAGVAECCSDYVVSSYTPTLSALLRAQQGPASYQSSEMKMLTIAASQAHNQNLPRLFNVAREAECVANIAGLAGASSMHITDSDGKADVREGLQAAHMVHFACHGIQDVAKPHQSHFSLASRDLTVSELMEMDLKDAFLAFLSACETATGTQEHADEAIHLAASMLFAGFRSVVATMWAMNDQDGPYIAKLFYEKLFEGKAIDVDAISYALDYATAALRATGVPAERWATFVHMGA